MATAVEQNEIQNVATRNISKDSGESDETAGAVLQVGANKKKSDLEISEGLRTSGQHNKNERLIGTYFFQSIHK